MESVELFLSVNIVIRAAVILLYALAALFCCWRLIPCLSPIAMRLAGFMLVAQVVVVAIAVTLQPRSGYEDWLWHLSREWNIPASLASAQLSLVGGVALATSWFASGRPNWERLFVVAIAIVFLFVAYDEYTAVHEFISDWERKYAVFGALLAMSTLVVAWRSPRRVRMWYILLLIGLAMSAAGGLVVEQLRHPEVCAKLGALSHDGCKWRRPIEESLEFFGIWLALVAMLGQLSDVSPAPARGIKLLLAVFPALWIIALIHTTEIVPVSDQTSTRPAAVAFASDVHLHAFSRKIGRETLTLNIFLSSKYLEFKDLGYSIHLVDQVTGESLVSHDDHADRQLDFVMGPGFVPVYRQWSHLVFPPAVEPNRALWITLTLWRAEGGAFLPLPAIASDRQQLNETQVILDEIVLKSKAARASSAVVAVFENGFALEQAHLPESARTGQTLDVTFGWRSDKDETEDLAQFLHFTLEASGEWWGYDQQPLGPRLPTRLWYRGLADSETWSVPLPADLKPGRYQVFTGLYRLSDQWRVPANDADGAPFADARALVGAITILA